MTASPERRSPLAGCCSLLCESPPSLAQTRRWHRRVDGVLTVSRPVIVPAFVALGFIAGRVADWLPPRLAALPAALFFALVGGWCSLNFVRCREAHCVVTGAGFGGLAGAAVVSLALGRDWTGALWLAALAVLAAGMGFEAAWTAWHGSRAVRRRGSLDRA